MNQEHERLLELQRKTPRPVERCPTCGSPNVERDDPCRGVNTCLDCGEESTDEGEVT